MARRSKVKVLSPAQMLEMAQKAETDVIYERTKLQIEEMKQRHHVRMAVITRLVQSADVTVKDVLERKEGKPDQVQLRDLTKAPDHIVRAIKKVRVTSRADGSQTVEVEMAHHLSYDELIGRYLGLFDGQRRAGTEAPPPPTTPTETGAPAPAKLTDLPLDQVRMHRARLEKEVEALSVSNSPEKDEKP